jgi:hypothetical protein
MSTLSCARSRKASVRPLMMCLIGLACAACSATTYSSQVDQFAAATSTTQSAFHALNDQAHASRQQLNIYSAIVNREDVGIDPSCGLSADGKCTISAKEPDGQLRPLVPHLQTSDASELMDALADYADGLQKLAKSEDIASLNDNIANLNGAINGLAENAAKLSGGTSPSATIGPAVTLVELVGITALETRRAQAFREIVIRANTPVSHAADIMALQADNLKLDILNNDSQVLKIKSGFVDDVRRSKPNDIGSQRDAITGVMQDAAAIDQIAAADPAQPFERMKAAHAALFAAVQKPDISVAELTQKTRAFYDAARNLYNAIQASRKD